MSSEEVGLSDRGEAAAAALTLCSLDGQRDVMVELARAQKEKEYRRLFRLPPTTLPVSGCDDLTKGEKY